MRLHATLLLSGFKFTEGPTADKNGNLFFVDIGSNRIHFYDIENNLLHTVRENSGGADGLYADNAGNLWICEITNRQVSKIDQNDKYHVVIDHYNHQPLSGPNDLWLDTMGGMYFTDSYSGHEDRGNHTSVFYYHPDDGLKCIDGGYYKSNGIHISNDNKYLYVADYLDDKIYRYIIDAPGIIHSRTLFAPYRCDGMTLDENGNLYVCTGNYGELLMINPEGQKIGEIFVPENPHNVCFGGKNRKTLFITATHGLYSLEMNVRGD